MNAPGRLTPETRAYLEDLIQQVRLFMRDFPHVNRLLAGEESSNRMVAWALQDACNDWNRTPPLIGDVGPTGHPANDLLIRKAAATLLMSVSFAQTRNHLSYADGRVQINSAPKGPEMRQFAQMLLGDYEVAKQRLKMAQNIEGAWGGGVFSDLLYANWYGEF